MEDFYYTTKEENQAEFVEKHSRFIGYCKPISTEQEAIDFINEKRKKHYDATHNVYAYSLKNDFIKRYSDDGEPQGTAGVPVLDVLNKNNMEKCYNCSVTLSYDFYGKLSGLIPECGGIIDDSNFLENVIISFHIPINELGFFNKKLADATNGKIEVEVVNEDYFPM